MPGLIMIMTPAEQNFPNPFLSSSMPIEDVADQLTSMHQQESTSYRCRDYIDVHNDATATTTSSSSMRSDCSQPSRRRRRREETIDRDCRSRMVEWSYQVSDFCKFQRSTVAMSMNYLDRFLATSSPRAHRALRDRKEFQLVSMTTLYIAIKLFEPLAMDAVLVAQISHGCYSEMDIVEMEQEILKSLGWRVNGPTADAFLKHILALLPPSAYGYDETTLLTLLDFSRFQAEVVVSDYDLSLQKPSTVALAAIMNSIEGIEKRLFSARSRFQFFQLIAAVSGLNPFSAEVNAARARLLKLFSVNSGYELPQIANLTPVIEEQCYTGKKLDGRNNMHQFMFCSPVSVARHLQTATGTTRAKCA